MLNARIGMAFWAFRDTVSDQLESLDAADLKGAAPMFNLQP
jgi:hypothetical protein